MSARKVCMRALLDKQEYVGGDGQVLHVRFPSKQLGESNVKIIGRLGRRLNRSVQTPIQWGSQ